MARSSEIPQRRAFLGLGDTDVERLRELRPTLEKHAGTIVSAFYRHLLSFAKTRELLRDPGVKQRVMDLQRDYVLSLGDPTFDEEFVERRRQIGRTHVRVGVEPRWYLGAYSLYYALLTPIVQETYAGDPERATAVLTSLQRLLTFDASLAMETYIERREQELTYLTHELEREGRRLGRDFEAQGAELRRTRARARTAEELASIATLVAGLAHEIGTPMGVIQGHARLLEPAVQGEEALERLSTIQEQIGRISRIIQTLLNMARPSRSERQPVALQPLLETTLSFVSEKLASRDIRVECDFGEVPSIVGDPERLQQLFLNLVLNATDAMPDGGVLRLALLPAEGEDVEVCVSDTGHGIPAENIERVFEPFFTTKEAGVGNGLGLMVAKGIAGDHGGSLTVSSGEGDGTTFCVHLPLPRAKLDEA